MPKSTKRPTPPQPQPPKNDPLLIDPMWMLKAIGATIVLAGVCGYIVICALFWHSQWQLVLSPSRVLAQTPADIGVPFEAVRFAPGAGGQPELAGWWVPALQTSDPTVLLLHGGSGSMSDVLREIRLLHDNRLNVLTFDYRGYGKSAGDHPVEQTMELDSEAALNYINGFRHVSSNQVIVFGEGLGASLAVRLCANHRDIAGLILENADGDFETRVALDTRSRLVPVGLLFNQRFPLADPLHTLSTPKLLISYTRNAGPPVDFARAADPKLTVELASPSNTAALSTSMRRFLDSYVAHPPSLLAPTSPQNTP